ncbi:MAG: NAD-dependent epimerase/dehydratase family protein, partial [bacterium]
MKSLVTGAAGFIGSTITEELLDKGHQVIGIDCFIDYYDRSLKENNMSSFIDHENFTLIEKNIKDLDLKELLKDIDYIFHQAAQAGVR